MGVSEAAAPKASEVGLLWCLDSNQLTHGKQRGTCSQLEQRREGGGLREGAGVGDSAPRRVHQVRVDELKRCMMPGVLWAVLGSMLHLGDD